MSNKFLFPESVVALKNLTYISSSFINFSVHTDRGQSIPTLNKACQAGLGDKTIAKFDRD